MQSVRSRFLGLRALLKLTNDKNSGAAQFGHMVYLMAAVLDPHYGYVWLDAGHPGDDNDKKALQDDITNAILVEAELYAYCSPNDSVSLAQTVRLNQLVMRALVSHRH